MLKCIAFTLITGFAAAMVMYFAVWDVIRNYVPHALILRVKVEIVIKLIYLGIPLVIIVSISSIILSHRVAGPLYHIEKQLNKYLDGENIPPIVLRNKDALRSLAAKINVLMAKINKRR